MLARLARDTDRQVRLFLYGPVSTGTDRRELTGLLREAAVVAARPYDLEVTVSSVGDRLRLRGDAAAAVTAAVAEAVTNVGKHANASRVTVFAEQVDGEVLVTVRDDGDGFDPAPRRRPAGAQRLDHRPHVRRRRPGRGGQRARSGHGGPTVDPVTTVRLVVADDHAVVRAGIRAELGTDFVVVGEADDAPAPSTS